MLPKLELTREGSTELFVPRESLGAREPKTFPAFFNPAARLNRDISVAIASATKPGSFLDALGGVGARGVRIANEASKRVEVTIVEFNRVSLAIAKKNAAKNRVTARCDLVHEESNAYLHSRFGRLERFDAVDIDPFGTPSSYLQGAVTAVADGGVVSVTATDTATLCGVYPAVSMRRYGARVVKTEFPHETGIRVLLGSSARVAGAVDIGIEPIAAHSTLHYLRVYFRAARGAGKADRSSTLLGYVASCGACHQNSVAAAPQASCPACGTKANWVGPQWVGPLVDDALVAKSSEVCSRLGYEEAARELKATIGFDTFPPFGYSLDTIASREGLSSVKFQRLVESLQASGHKAMRHPFEYSALKTTASYREVVDAVKSNQTTVSAASKS